YRVDDDVVVGAQRVGRARARGEWQRGDRVRPASQSGRSLDGAGEGQAGDVIEVRRVLVGANGVLEDQRLRAVAAVVFGDGVFGPCFQGERGPVLVGDEDLLAEHDLDEDDVFGLVGLIVVGAADVEHDGQVAQVDVDVAGAGVSDDVALAGDDQ